MTPALVLSVGFAIGAAAGFVAHMIWSWRQTAEDRAAERQERDLRTRLIRKLVGETKDEERIDLPN